MITVDVSDLTRLAADMGVWELRLAAKGRVALAEAGNELRDAWKDNARITAGQHGKHYPNSIKAKPVGPFTVEVGPTPGMRQGAMSFEYGSSNQPPHLDGQRALDETLPKLTAKLEAAIAGAFL